MRFFQPRLPKTEQLPPCTIITAIYRLLPSPRDDKSGQQLSVNRVFSDERWSQNRTVTSLDWSPQFPELLAARWVGQGRGQGRSAAHGRDSGSADVVGVLAQSVREGGRAALACSGCTMHMR